MSIHLFHKTAFGFYNVSWSIALPWLRFHHRLAEGYKQRTLKDRLPAAADLWIQAASVGESWLALELIKTLETRDPLRILLTSNTQQGIQILDRGLDKQITETDRIKTYVRYFPFDKPSIMVKAVISMRPKLMVILETELWPGHLRALKAHGCKIVIINGRITTRSLKRYLLWPSIWQALRPDKILAISQTDADRFGQLFGQDGIEVMPNIKFDRIASSPTSGGHKNTIKALVPPAIPFVVLASVRRPEEPLVKKIIYEVFRNRPETVIGLFPRHMNRVQYWQESLNQMGIRWFLRSATATQVTAGTVVIWDTFGELLPAYRLAKSAFVGGSLAPLGGQNFLEALVSGVLPVIGPSWENFAWVGQQIIDCGLLRVAGDWKEVAALILKDMDSSPRREEVIETTLQLVKARQGGTQIACRQIADCLAST
jgi:3-deoxy-D-manno-octulosonic-acid transferase